MALGSLFLAPSGRALGLRGHRQGSLMSFSLQDCDLGQEQHNRPWAPGGGSSFGEVRKEPLGRPGLLPPCKRASGARMSPSLGPLVPLKQQVHHTFAYRSQGSWSTARALQPAKQPATHLVTAPFLLTSGPPLGSAPQPSTALCHPRQPPVSVGGSALGGDVVLLSSLPMKDG